MKNLKNLFIFLALFSFAPPSSADSTLENLANKSISSGLNSLGNLVQSLIPGDGDTEVSFRTQNNYDLLYSNFYLLVFHSTLFLQYPFLTLQYYC